jgi:hypothetical protein
MTLGVMGGLPIHALHLGSPVILVNNLDPERAMPEPLFNLFSTCGTVQRIKILYNKRDSALIQVLHTHTHTHLNLLYIYIYI